MRQIYPNHENQLARLGKIEGQLRGIRKMIEDRRYCIDIISQIKAVAGALEQVQMGVLEKHVHHCVREAVEAKDGALLEEKVEEMVKVLGKMG
jgi:DNA-binding FrmR family transcriptional regulator